MHSTRRDAFETRNGGPLGYVEDDRVHLDPGYRKRNGSGADTIRADALDPRGVLVWFYPGLEPEAVARAVEGKRGAVLAGTGLGHTASSHLGWIRDAAARGLVLAMTTQCLGGTTDPYVYETGRELLRAGVLYLGDMLPEAAYAKLLWALGQSERPERVRELLLEDRAGERADRRELDPRASPT
jgi:glutamyl-tRNA(Gln) amidotransferase subunit D